MLMQVGPDVTDATQAWTANAISTLHNLVASETLHDRVS